MKKICFVVYDISVLGGAEQVAVNLANRLCENYDVQIYSICGKEKNPLYQMNSNIHIEFANNKNRRIRQLLFENRKKFNVYLKRNSIDIAFLIGVYSGGITALSQPVVKTKFVFCDHGALMNQWKEKDITVLRWIASKLSDRTVVLTDRTKNDYIEKFHINSRKILRIYNWVNTNKSEMSLDYNINSKKIVTVGRISKEKGFDLLVKVAEKVLPKYPEWTWEVLGDGEDFDKIYALIKEKGLQTQLIMKGCVQNASKYFNQYSFYVLPSYREGLPLVLLEAKANKLPIISFDIETGPREIVNEENGILIKPYNCDAMAEAIAKLIEDADLRMKMSKKAEDNLDKFTMDTILKQWMLLINEL